MVDYYEIFLRSFRAHLDTKIGKIVLYTSVIKQF